MRLNCMFFLLILKQFDNFSFVKWIWTVSCMSSCTLITFSSTPSFSLCFSINLSSPPQVLFSDSWLWISSCDPFSFNQVSYTTTGWKVSTGGLATSSMNIQLKARFSSSLNLSVASSSAVGVRVLWVSSPPMGDCWQLILVQIQEKYVQLLWVHDCRVSCPQDEFLKFFSSLAFIYPFGSSQECSLSFRRSGVNVLFRVEHSSIFICRTL